MTKNPLLILCLFLLVRQQPNGAIPTFSRLQLESMIDQLHTMIHTLEKVNSITHADVLTSLPDMKKMLEAVEKIPL